MIWQQHKEKVVKEETWLSCHDLIEIWQRCRHLVETWNCCRDLVETWNCCRDLVETWQRVVVEIWQSVAYGGNAD